MATKILKNNTGSTMQILNRDIPEGGQYNVPHGKWDMLADDSSIITKIENQEIIVNNGEEDLPISVAKIHVCDGALKVHRSMNILPGLGENCPALVSLNSACVGYEVEIEDKGYIRARADNIIGDFFCIEFHFCIDNIDEDKYVSFKAYVTTTSGDGDQYLDNHDVVYEFGPLITETDPFKIFSYKIQLPTTLFENDEKYIYVGLERVANEEGYNNPTNNPIIVDIDQIYWKRVV